MKLEEALETLKNNGAKVIKESVEDVYNDIFENIYDISDVECDSLCNVIKLINEADSYERALKFKKDLIDMFKGLR